MLPQCCCFSYLDQPRADHSITFRQKLQVWPIFLSSRKMILHMEFERQGVSGLDFEQERQTCCDEVNGVVCHVLPNTPAGAKTEWVKGGSKALQFRVGLDHPTLWLEDLRLRVHFRAPVHGPCGNRNLCVRREVMAVNRGALGGFPCQKAGHAGGHPQRFFHAGPQILAVL